MQPQAKTLPSCFSARLWKRPAATAVTPLWACGGTAHCPKSVSPPQPQERTVPSFFTARLSQMLAAIPFTSLPAPAGSALTPVVQAAAAPHDDAAVLVGGG